ncbi:putative tag-253 protein [Rutstroemia sp. NJR-2017a WRK4]|nr:putative tag-253 protein [Rutstroemia sp. NJR-2017a WRK4]PQE11809.1 putative tag-253 protein [Rutstroemia sp. NJR-2017a WRK4]
MSTREASHAGSWYTSRSSTLSAELDDWLDQVPPAIDGKELPVPGARIIIAPHAGYSYSGPAAAWAYKSLDLSKAKRIFLLGPSHAWYLSKCALSTHAKYATPLGDLIIDQTTVKELADTNEFLTMSPEADETEHSLEMHLPYIYKRLSQQFSSPSEFPKLVPILVGSTKPDTEKKYGALLAKYLADESSVFVVSSDFCHWGLRFQYTYYLPASPSAEASGYSLQRRDKSPTQPQICESIGRLDKQAMDAIEGGKHKDFLNNLKETGNTVCGRHPIGVVMAAIETLKEDKVIDGEEKGRFKFVRYERSSEVIRVDDSSVSYASAYAVL